MNDATKFWEGSFGNSYTDRNELSRLRIERQARLWSKIVGPMLPERPKTILEVGSNTGANLWALHSHFPSAHLYAVEPNDKARDVLVKSGLIAEGDAYAKLTDVPGTAELAFTCGCLIHIPPAELYEFCRGIVARAERWVVAIEYFAAEPEEKVYRGHAGKLWKRDFGGFYLDNFAGLKPIGTGFAWKRTTGLDNLTWWLFDKGKA